MSPKIVINILLRFSLVFKLCSEGKQEIKPEEQAEEATILPSAMALPTALCW